MPKSIEHFKDPEHWKIKRSRNTDHLENCSSGYYKPVKWPFSAVHHIVPISSVADATIFDELGQNVGDFMVIRFCLAETDWDINSADNTIGLPMKMALVYKSSNRWNGYPCHEVDHNPHYTKRVSDNLKDKVWNPALKKAEECEFKGENLEAALKARSKVWRKFLTSRGASHQGTQHCWKHREDIPNTWYIPFSMHPGTPTKRKPPPDWDAMSGKVKEKLKELFSIIK